MCCSQTYITENYLSPLRLHWLPNPTPWSKLAKIQYGIGAFAIDIKLHVIWSGTRKMPMNIQHTVYLIQSACANECFEVTPPAWRMHGPEFEAFLHECHPEYYLNLTKRKSTALRFACVFWWVKVTSDLPFAKAWTEAFFDFQEEIGWEHFLESFTVHVFGSKSKIDGISRGSYEYYDRNECFKFKPVYFS